MLSIDDLREFLRNYQSRQTYSGYNSTPQLGDRPSRQIRDQQQTTVNTSDGHVIPLSDFEFRIRGEDSQHGDDPNFVRYEDIMPFIESEWDQLVGQYGLNAVCTYAPFHESIDTYGIYIQQRGIRHLGHLLYQWSRVGALSSTPQQATKLLSNEGLQDSDFLLQGEPQFDSLDGAFELAKEILLRHQWFHHQFELLAAHIEDVADTLCYPQYYRQVLSIDAIEQSLEDHLANTYAARSRACKQRAPAGLYQPLLKRALAATSQSQSNLVRNSAEFTQGRVQASARLRTGSATAHGSQGIALARELVFESDIQTAVPSRLAVYVTRSEPDSDNSSYAPNESPLGQTCEISLGDKWKKKYSSADQNIKNLVDIVEDRAKKQPRTLEKKGVGEGPKNRFYGDLNSSKRFVYEMDLRKGKVDLIDFGGHDLPRKYGLYKS